MDHAKILKKSWNILWNYRALWFFGIILALTTSSGLAFPPGDGNTNWREDATIPVPFIMTEDDWGDLDLQWTQDLEDEFQELERLFETGVIPRTIIRILIWTGITVFFLIVISRIARYVSEAALLRMVDDYEKTGERRSVGKGLRMGWSRTAWRLFLINLVINVPAWIVSMLLLVLAAAPMLTAHGWRAGMPIAGRIILSTGLLIPVFILLVVGSAVLRLLKRLARRACALEGLGVMESISRGFDLGKRHLKEVGITWLINLGLRLVWQFVLVPACLLVLFASGAVVVGIALLLASGWKAIVVAAFIFFFILFAPLAFVSGLVEVYLSSMWTLTYRELLVLEESPQGKVLEEPVQEKDLEPIETVAQDEDQEA